MSEHHSKVTLVLTAFLVGSLGAAVASSGAPTAEALGAATPSRRSAVGSALACPLTRPQQRTAMDAFQQMLPVLLHPRCLNCHGGVNPFVNKPPGGHQGGKMDLPERAAQCQECHDGLPGWTVPGSAMFWVGKTTKQLCVQLKDFAASVDFVDHITRDGGGTPFIESAFRGDRALNSMAQDIVADSSGRPFAPAPPPGTHPQLIQQAKDWISALGAGLRAAPDCGCVATGKAWIGSVTTVFELHTPTLGMLIETATSTARFVVDSSFITPGDPAEYWKSVSGTIHWQTSATGGACVGGGSGSLPIGLGSDQNPMAGLRLEPDTSKTVRFTVSIGPWPDQYTPKITYTCRNAPPLVAPLFAATQWWGHPAVGETVSADGYTLSGSYKTALGGGTIEWHWDFRLVP